MEAGEMSGGLRRYSDGRNSCYRFKFPVAGFVLMVVTTVVHGQSCPDAWEAVGQKCFRFLMEGKNWEQSRAYCASIGGSLVVLETSEETAYLVDKMRLLGGHTFLGCRDVVTEGHWVCEGYDPSTFFYDYGGSAMGHWQTATHPFATNGGTDENCMEIWYSDTSSFMNDVSCATVDPLVSCQRNPAVTTPASPTTLPVQMTTESPQPPTTAPHQASTASGPTTAAPQHPTTEATRPTDEQQHGQHQGDLSLCTPAKSWFVSPAAGSGQCLHSNHVVTRLQTRPVLDCALRCKHAQWCASFSVIQDGDDAQMMTCQLNDARLDDSSSHQETVGCITFNKVLC